MLLCRTGRLLIYNCRYFLDIENTGHASQSHPPLKAYKLQQGLLPSSLMTRCTTRLAGKQTESHLDVLEITWYHISARTSNVLTWPALLLQLQLVMLCHLYKQNRQAWWSLYSLQPERLHLDSNSPGTGRQRFCTIFAHFGSFLDWPKRLLQ